MIRNERQLRVAQEKRDAAREAANLLDEEERVSYRDFAQDLQDEIDEYCGIRDGFVSSFVVESLDSVGDALIKARIARKWTQKQLAGELGVSEQMVQKDESGAYEKASLARLAEILDVLGYEFNGTLVPKDESESEHHFGSQVLVHTSTPSDALFSWYNDVVAGWPLAIKFSTSQPMIVSFHGLQTEWTTLNPFRAELTNDDDLPLRMGLE